MMNKPESTKKGCPGLRKSPWKPARNWRQIGMLAIGLLLAGLILGQATGTGLTASPGSEDDPLVTVSWVKSTVSQALQEEQNQRKLLEERLQRLEEGKTGRPSPAEPVEPVEPFYPAPVFEVVSVVSGKKLLTGTGTEIILRGGRAKALAGPGGGLSDLTAGCDLSTGQEVKSNHHLLSSRDDGRGVTLETDAFLLVRGGYTLE